MSRRELTHRCVMTWRATVNDGDYFYHTGVVEMCRGRLRRVGRRGRYCWDCGFQAMSRKKRNRVRELQTNFQGPKMHGWPATFYTQEMLDEVVRGLTGLTGTIDTPESDIRAPVFQVIGDGPLRTYGQVTDPAREANIRYVWGIDYAAPDELDEP